MLGVAIQPFLDVNLYMLHSISMITFPIHCRVSSYFILFLQGKKSKKKNKQAVKENKTQTVDGKELEEGEI